VAVCREGGAVAYLKPSSVRLEATGRVLCGHTALDGEAIYPDLILLQAQLWQATPLTHVQLSMNQVHTDRKRSGRIERENYTV
jgi:hypothetical protein